MLEWTSLTKKAKFFAVGMLAGLLVACGGGGGAGCTKADPSRKPNLPSCGGSSPATAATTPTTGIAMAPLTLTLTDVSGATTTSVSPDRAGTLKAVVKDSKGNAAPNIVVSFTTTDKTGVFVPSSSTALT